MAKGSRSGKSDRSSAYNNPLSLDASLLSPLTISSLPQPHPDHAGYVKAPAGDLRQYHPLRRQLSRPPPSLTRDATRLTVGDAARTIRYAMPDRIALCIRRKVRREIIHALKLTHKRGKGGARRRNRFSNIQC